ncbi:helix-turn-helix domain-containing protein [Nocardia inohanensis]|uniref:helix-turn-helix domain-containing protein n=1 Tax=Nocardia inohanensis TaxID=209246 RepID=UPI00082F2D89|nr:helix-turn-helix domain-containing protein [Nocardia inohanensis]
MAFTEHEAKVLATLAVLESTGSLTVNELCKHTALTETAVRHALLRLSRDGLAMHTRQAPSRYRSTSRGALAIRRPVYRQFRRPTESQM